MNAAENSVAALAETGPAVAEYQYRTLNPASGEAGKWANVSREEYELFSAPPKAGCAALFETRKLYAEPLLVAAGVKAALLAKLEEMREGGYTADWTLAIAVVSNALSGKGGPVELGDLNQQGEPAPAS